MSTHLDLNSSIYLSVLKFIMGNTSTKGKGRGQKKQESYASTINQQEQSKQSYKSPQSQTPPNPSQHSNNSNISTTKHSSDRSNGSNTSISSLHLKKVEIGNVLNRPMEDLRETYTLGRELGRGQFGITRLCTNKSNGELYACKTISKRKLTHKEDIEDVRREVQIMHLLTGHPNIVELKGAYEDKSSVHLVMELCAGGELFDRIIAKGKFSERVAAGVMRTMIEVVRTCHSLGVMHRDLKPENFLLLNKSEDSPLKTTDFGLSIFFKPGT